MLMVSSKGAAAVTGGGFITLAATLQAIGTVPVAGITLLLGVDRFMSEMRALTRSEEHTSELQSLRQLVCRLLLEKNFVAAQWRGGRHRGGRAGVDLRIGEIARAVRLCLFYKEEGAPTFRPLPPPLPLQI